MFEALLRYKQCSVALQLSVVCIVTFNFLVISFLKRRFLPRDDAVFCGDMGAFDAPFLWIKIIGAIAQVFRKPY